MIDPILLVGFALVGGAALMAAPLPTAVAVVLIAFALRRNARAITLAVCGAALLINSWRVQQQVGHAVANYGRTTELLQPPTRCEAHAVVVTSPIVIGQARQAADEPPTARVDVELTAGRCERSGFAGPLRARVYGAPVDLGRGDSLDVVVDLAPVHLFRNEGLRNGMAGIARTGVTASGAVVTADVVARAESLASWIDRARNSVRRRINATFHPAAIALGRALVLGETDLEAEDDEAFRESGLAHLLAVSGTHLILAVAAFSVLLRGLLVRIFALAARWDVGRITAAICIPAAWLYADFAGGGGSAIRAAAMLSCGMLARVLGRRSVAIRNFAWSLVGAAMVDPLIGYDLSFGLSAAATAGLLWLDRPLAGWLVRGPEVLRKVLKPIATTLAAMLGCAPVTLIISPSVPLLGIFANVVAAPLGELAALPFCLVHALLAWAPAVEQGCAFVGSGALLAVRAIARSTAQTDAVLRIPEPSAPQLAVLVVMLAAMAAASSRARKIAAIAVGAAAWLLLELTAIRAGAPKGLLRVNVLDVGQGDSVLVDLPHGGALLVDAGGFVGTPVDPGTRVLRPLLRFRRRTKLDVVVLSHPHPDHFGGLPSTVDGLEVGEFWDTGQGEAFGAGPVYKSLLAGLRKRKVPVVRPSTLCQQPRTISGAIIEILAPCPAFDEDRSANDNSFVLHIHYGARSALLMGDAEHEEEASLVMQYGASLQADLLKVGHHGSVTSTTPRLVEAVKPSLAAISCGVRNRFGHPRAETLSTLTSHGVEVVRTDRGGMLIWETDGETARWYRP